MPLLSTLLFLVALQTPPGATSREAPERSVGREEILAAMMESGCFDLTKTTNGARLQAEVLLRLARKAQARDAESAPLFIGHEDWFSAYLERTGLPGEQAPIGMRCSHKYKQDIRVQYGNDRVIRRVVKGPKPALALSVRIAWPERPNGPNSYSYEDSASRPKLRVTNKRLIAYRLLDFGDMVVFDEIKGFYGRPTSGFLEFLFKLIGEGQVVQSRLVFSPGLQVSRARVERALLHVEPTVTVYPDGRTENGLPQGCPDRVRLETLLKRELKIEYWPLDPTFSR
jgi:hypothetical protein